MASDGTIKISTELDSTSAQAAMSKFGSIAKTGLKGVATTVGVVSTALLGAAGYAVKTGITFESSFAGVKKTVNATSEEMDVLRDGILDMSKRIPSSASAIAEVAEAAGQLGIQNKNILSFTEVMTNMGVATNMSSTEAATSLARLANITQMPQENFDRLGSTIVALGNNLATTESEITETGLRLAGAGKQVGMSEAQIMGLAAAISSVGIEADAGGSAVSTVMAKMQLAVEKGGDSLNEFASVAGMSADEFSSAFKNDAAGALTAFVTGLGTMDEKGQSSIKTLDDMGITEIRQRDALLRLSGAGEILAKSIGIATDAWDENNALTKEAEQRYETLESKLTILKNNVDDFGIAIYDGMREPLKDTVDEGIEAVGRLQSAFESGGLHSAVKEAGNIFADVATDVANQAPKMVDSAVDFIGSFCDGIYENRGELISAAGTVASTLAEGMAELLPASVRKPAQDAVDAITKSFESGGLKKTVEVVGDTLENLGNITGTVAKVALPPLTKAIDLLGNNLELTAASATALFTAFKGYKQVQSSTSVFNKAKQAISGMATITRDLTAAGTKAELAEMALGGALTKNEIVIGALTGKISLATAGQTAWNAVMAANPVGLVVTGIAALVAGISAYVILTGDSKTAIEEENEALADQVESMRDAQAARSEAADGISSEYTHYQEMWEELQNLADASGNVAEKDRERAGVITSTLSDALGIEISLVDGQIQNYEDLQSSIYGTIEAKKAEAILSAYQSDYSDALKEQAEAQETLTKKLSELNAKREESADLQNKINNISAKGNEATQEDLQNQENLAIKLAGVNEELSNAETAYNNAKTAMDDHITTVSNYEALQAAVKDGTGSVSESLLKLTNDFKTAENSDRASLEQQVVDATTKMQETSDAIKNGSLDAKDESVANYAQLVTLSLAELAKLPDGYNSEVNASITDMLAAMQEMQGGFTGAISQMGPEASAAMANALATAKMSGQLNNESTKSMESFIDGFAGLDAETQETWSQAWYGALKGLEGFEDLKDPAQDGADAFLESLRTALEVHSPSQAVADIFGQVWPGASQGLEQGKEDLKTKGSSVITDFLTALSNGGLFEGAKSIGTSLMNFFGLGISEQSGNSSTAGKANADAANTGAGSVDPTGTGSSFGYKFGAGVSGQSGTSQTAGKANATAANSGAGSVDPSGTGSTFGGKYASGVGSKSGEANSSGTRLASSANSGADTGDGYGVGSDFGSGFVSGIGSWISDAATKAAELASNAYNAAKKWLDEHSPSKKTKKLGKWFSQGLGIGIEEEGKSVEKSAELVSQSALDAIDTESISEKLKGIDIGATISSMYADIDARNNSIADRIIVKVEAMERLDNQRREQSVMKANEVLQQEINIYQPVKSPVETARALKKVGREIAFGK